MTDTARPDTTADTAPADSVPPGFEPHYRRSPVTDSWRPLYSRIEAESVSIGLVVDDQHCNGRGFLHGGVIASLADNAMGLSVGRAAEARNRPIEGGALTLGLSVSYLSPVPRGTWINVQCRVHDLGGQIGVVDSLVVDTSGSVAARADATFRYRKTATP